MNGNDLAISRRVFLGRSISGASGIQLGSIALASLLGREGSAESQIAAKAKRVIYLVMHGGPSQLDLFDFKPGLKSLHGQELPGSVRGNQRLTGMTSGQSSFPM